MKKSSSSGTASHKKKFVTNLFLLLALNLFIKPFWILGIDREVQNLLGSEEYGLYFALFNLSLVLNILLDAGITNFNNRNISQHSFLLKKHLSSLVILKFFLAVVYTVVLMSVGLLMDYEARNLKLLFLLGFNQFLLSLVLYLRSNIAGLQLFKIDSFISVLDRLLMIIICSFVLWNAALRNSFSVENFIYIQTFCYLATAFITLIIVVKKAKLKKLKWNYPMLLIILRQSFPFAILILLMSFYNRIDTVMIERILPDGKFQAGIYAQAYRLLDSANMIAYLFSVLLLPLFSKMLKQQEKVMELSNLAFRILVIPALICVGLSIAYSKEIMTLLYKDADASSIAIFPILMACFLPICSSYVFGTLLTANGSLKELNIVALSSMLLNIVLNTLLIPEYKALGAAIASLITQVCNSLAQLFIIRRKFNSKPEPIFVFLLLAFAVICLKGISLIAFELKLFWMLEILILGALTFSIAFFMRLINIQGLIGILKNQ